MMLYRFSLCAYGLCLLALILMLAPWVHYYLGPEMSIYDIGSPQLRAAI